MNVRTLALVSAMAVALPMTAAAQSRVPQAGPRIQTQSPAFRTGFDRGQRLGEEDGRRNSRFDYASKSEYRNADAGYNRNYGDRERYRSEFRVGFEDGYRQGYSRYQSGNGGYGGYNDGTWRPGTGGPPPWANGRGRGQGNGNGSWQRNDLAFQNGFTDGYDEGTEGRPRSGSVRSFGRGPVSQCRSRLQEQLRIEGRLQGAVSRSVPRGLRERLRRRDAVWHRLRLARPAL